MEYVLFDQWESVLDRYKHAPNIEIEIRFGRKSGHNFDTNVGSETFQKCLKSLDTYTGWESKRHDKFDVYYFEGGKRLQINEQTEERDSVIKQRVLVDDFALPGLPFDVRLGVSTETPFEYDGETATEQKTKERWSFVRKNLSIDLSKVQGTPDDPDDDEDTSYQIEMEIIDPAQLQTRDDAFKLMYKVFDLMKCV